MDLQSPHRVDPGQLKSTFGLHACLVESSSYRHRVTLIGVRDRVQCAVNQCHLLVTPSPSSRSLLQNCRVSCAAADDEGNDPRLLEKHLRMAVNGHISQAEEVCAAVNSARFSGNRAVSAYVAGVRDEAVLVVCGHESVISAGAASAASEVEFAGMQLCRRTLFFSRHELMWIYHNRLLEPFNDFAVIESTVPYDSLAADMERQDDIPVVSETNKCTWMVTMHDIVICVKEMNVVSAITEHSCDTLLCAVHPLLLNDFGLSKCVSDMAGGAYAQACASTLSHFSKGKGLVIGRAYHFEAHELKKMGLVHLINSVLPVHHDPSSPVPRVTRELFRKAVMHALDVATAFKAITVAIPGMDGEAFGYDLMEAATLTVDAVIDWVREYGSTSTIKKIVMFDACEQVTDKFLSAWEDVSRPCTDMKENEERGRECPDAVATEEEYKDPCLKQQLLPMRPLLPDRQWYWSIPPYDHRPRERARVISVKGKNVTFAPFSYDQTMMIEEAYGHRCSKVDITDGVSDWMVTFKVPSDQFGFIAYNAETKESRMVTCCLMDLSDPPPEYCARLAAYRESVSSVEWSSADTYPCQQEFVSESLHASRRSPSASTSVDYGLVLYGLRENVDLVAESVLSCVSASIIEKQISIALLCNHSPLSFDQCLERICTALRPYGGVVTSSDSSTWTLFIKAVGPETVAAIEYDICLVCVSILCT